jgi:tetratricopeptide (TPR) repeat protein
MRQTMVLIAVSLFAAAAFAQEHRHGGGASTNLGTVSFANSCEPGVQSDFNHAVALLHSFEYDEARDAFLGVAKKDPSCAMAYWGAAMTHFHGLWGEVDVENGRKFSAQANEVAQANAKTTAREKAFIDAVSAIYTDSDVPINKRSKNFSDAMAQVHAANPSDDEATVFYALSLDESAGRDPSYANQRKCGELLDPLFRKLPTHPGVTHYLIHCYDNAALASKGIDAARNYAKIAADSAHATHMPSHIFVRLGMWPDTVESNLLSLNAAERDKAASACQSRGNGLHAMHFLQFAYLQMGQQKDAKHVAERALNLPELKDCGSGEYVAASYALDATDWEMANRLPFGDGGKWTLMSNRDDEITLMAIGLGAARTGNIARAQQAEQGLEKWRDDASKARGTPCCDGPRLVVAAWLAEAQQDHEKALELMRSAVEKGMIADEMTWVHPPSSEQLGDLLMQQHKPAEALAAYRKALEGTPNLFNALYGSARAAGEAGDAAAAASYYRKLAEVASKGDRPEVEIARKKAQESKASGGM